MIMENTRTNSPSSSTFKETHIVDHAECVNAFANLRLDNDGAVSFDHHHELPTEEELMNAIAGYPSTQTSFAPHESKIRACSNLYINKFRPNQTNPFAIVNYGSSSVHHHNADTFYPYAPSINGKSGLSLGTNVDFFDLATSPDSSELLRRFLEKGRHVEDTMRGVLPSIIQLMCHPQGQRVFQILLERCEIRDLCSIVAKVSSESQAFLNAAFCETGSRSIQRLVKKLKNTGMESQITRILPEFAWDLMTHKIASHVIRRCFLVLGDEPNQVLHDIIFACFVPLAMDPTGCITINDCIESIKGPRRSQLLDLVANNACQLSYDPSGNFVVQHVLGLQNELVTLKICISLKGQFANLALKKGGSHVVEKCLQSGAVRGHVMDEIFRSDETFRMLAKDQFGNYVVQTALNLARIHDEDMYDRLVRTLQPRYSRLVYKAIMSNNNKFKGGEMKQQMLRA